MLIPSMTGNDLVRFNRGFFPRWSDALARRYAEVLELDMKRKFKKLSTGNRTKLCLLLALAQGAELILLDEPTAGMDPVVTDQLLRVMVEDFANEGRTLFLSSHHLSEVERIAEWVGIIDHGKLLLEARLEDMRTQLPPRARGGRGAAAGRAAGDRQRQHRRRHDRVCGARRMRTRSWRSLRARARPCST